MLRGWTQGDVGGEVGTDGYTVNRWERGRAFPSPYFRQRLCALFEKNAEELGLLSRKGCMQKPPALPRVWNVPYRRNLFFTGRESYVSYLYRKLHVDNSFLLGQIRVISGPAGIGKTQVAIEYTYRYAMDYTAVLWIRSDSPTTLLSSLADTAQVLGLLSPLKNDPACIASAVKLWLKEHAGWLLVMDNIEDPELAADFIPLLHSGHILITTRSQITGNIADRIDIEKMSQEEGSLFLLRRAKLLRADACFEDIPLEGRVAAGELVRILDGLPLAIDQAASYIEVMGCGIAHYLLRYQNERIKMLSFRDSSLDHPASVYTTWSLTFEKIRYSNRLAFDVLQLCAYLHADDIPEEFLREAASELHPATPSLANDPILFDTITSELRKFSLIRRFPETSTLSIHRLIQVILRENMEQPIQQRFIKCLVHTFNRILSFSHFRYLPWSLDQRYLLHILECVQHVKQLHIYLPEMYDLLLRIGEHRQEHGHEVQAESMFQMAHEIRGHIHTTGSSVSRQTIEFS